ncbi:MAG: thiamine-phosphate kinase [Ignavibacteriae bacterium]|nr:thiamine-phosphate kinase [Ignavibacteriota bacterium]
MQVKNIISENNFVETLCRNLKRSTLQVNKLNESDAEIISLPGTSVMMAVTTDVISEEIEKGLYTDPYQIGWMAVMVNASDISAVGAEPLGLLLNETFKENDTPEFISEIQRGINDACGATGFFVLGGDTNFSSVRQFGATAIGLINDDKVVTRKGCREGDLVYISGYAGRGSAYALTKIYETGKNIKYMPESRIQHGKIMRKYASCCMDTSDGVITTLDQLMRVNKKGFIIDAKPDEYIDTESIEMAKLVQKSPLIMLAGQHGEFELVFTVNEKDNDAFLKEAKIIGWNPIRIGKVCREIKINIAADEIIYYPDSARIRNLLSETKGNTEEYIQELFKIFSF